MTSRRIDSVLSNLARRSGRRRWLGAGLVAVLLLALAAAGCTPSVPDRQQDLCAVFHQHPDWFDYAREAEDTWDVPIHILMAFVHHESRLSERCAAAPQVRSLGHPMGPRLVRQGVRPGAGPGLGGLHERARFLLAQPLGHGRRPRLHRLVQPRDVARAGDRQDRRAQPLSRLSRGPHGYRRGSYKAKPALQRIARRVAETASSYEAQLERCESDFRCDAWYQVWPLCS